MPARGSPFAARETLEQLDWPWFAEQIRRHLRTAPARERCGEQLWLRDSQEAGQALQEVEEARILLRQDHRLPIGAPPDIRPHQVRIRKGAILEPDELSEVASWIEALEGLRRFLVIHRQEAPLLYRYAEAAPSLSHLLYDVRSCVSSSGEVRDEASPALSSLRKKAKRVYEQIHEKLAGYLNAKEYQDLLQDHFYTIKEERYVLPIKTQQRSFVEGIVLGSSNSGATLFIEPREIVELNNTHKLALLEIQNEIRRILREICDHLLEEAGELQRGEAFLTELDLIQSKAALAEELGATVPTMLPEAGLRLIAARHPILAGKQEVVPNDVVLAPPTRVLLITGPNTGGKTVVLKTVGLLALMVRAGCPIPSAAGSNIPFFDQIFSDIGDDQSIQENRSSFSGHVLRVAGFLSSATCASLALLDEILISTDPEEGAMLAQAILEHFADAEVTCLATTHFLALKSLAAQDPRFQNASLGFHPETLRPTYHLSQGLPGGSHAIHIASRLGLPAPVLDRAMSLRGASGGKLEALLLQVQEARQELEAEKQRWSALSEESRQLKQELERKKAEVLSRERDLKGKYRQRLETAYQEAMRELESWRRRRKGAGQASTTPSKLYRDLVETRREALSEPGPFHEEPQEEPVRAVDWSEARCGDTIYLPALRTEARIVKMPDRKGNLTVETDGFRMQVKSDQVRARKEKAETRTIRAEQPAPSSSRKKAAWAASAEESSEETLSRCDLRGLTVEEALDRASRHLDRSFLAHLSRVSLVHGLGTGALRTAVRDYLSRSPYPVSFRPGAPEEGGDGVTVVEFGGGPRS
ncbi:MAG: Smr/MutS family protein [bacterium]